MGKELWEKWDSCHNDAGQKKRQASAKKTACTPTFVDYIEQTGTFVGSSGHYTVSLDHCTCVDFNRRKLPCKHMYRLAMELGLMDGEYESNTADVVAPIRVKIDFPECVEIVESLSVDAQIFFKNLLHNMNSKDIYRRVVCSPELTELMGAGLLEESSNPKMQLSGYKIKELKERLVSIGYSSAIRSKEELVDWIINNLAEYIPKICSDTIIVRVPEGVKYQKAYLYLLRKFDNDSYVDDNMVWHDIPHGAVFSTSVGINGVSGLILQFPDDDVTDLLNKYNANRCKGWSLDNI